MAQSQGATNIGSVGISYMHDISDVYHFCPENRWSKILFSNPFPKNSADCESQKSEFGFASKNPPRLWIL